MYDWKGRWIEEDDDAPTLRRHCITCGAFLPTRPEETAKAIPSEWATAYDEQGEIIAITILNVQKETEWTWDCKKCGREHDSDEMYT
jgi:hypothetical protein